MRQLTFGIAILTTLISLFGCNGKSTNTNNEVRYKKEHEELQAHLDEARRLLAKMDTTANVVTTENVVMMKGFGVNIMGIYTNWRTSSSADSLMKKMSQCSPKRLAYVMKMESLSRKLMSKADNLPNRKVGKKTKWFFGAADSFVEALRQFTEKNICKSIGEDKSRRI